MMSANFEVIRVVGRVMEILPGPLFRVRLENGYSLLAHLPRRHRLRAGEITVAGDVQLDLTPYDLSRGRIVLPEVPEAAR